MVYDFFYVLHNVYYYIDFYKTLGFFENLLTLETHALWPLAASGRGRRTAGVRGNGDLLALPSLCSSGHLSADGSRRSRIRRRFGALDSRDGRFSLMGLFVHTQETSSSVCLCVRGRIRSCNLLRVPSV